MYYKIYTKNFVSDTRHRIDLLMASIPAENKIWNFHLMVRFAMVMFINCWTSNASEYKRPLAPRSISASTRIDAGVADRVQHSVLYLLESSRLSITRANNFPPISD